MSLRAADEPAPFEVFNEEASASVILFTDHASRFIPRSLDTLGLDEASLSRHIAYDIGIAEVTKHLARKLDATAILSGFSRLVIDPNRRTDVAPSIPDESDGTIIPGNSDLGLEERGQRIREFFEPYHAAIDALITRRIAAGRWPVLVSMHSFAPVMNAFERPWKIGILWNHDARLPIALIDRLRAMGLPVGDNEPYSGRDGHGYTQHVHGDARGIANALIEVRQDLIDTHQGAEEWGDLLGGVLRELLSDPELYRPYVSA